MPIAAANRRSIDILTLDALTRLHLQQRAQLAEITDAPGAHGVLPIMAPFLHIAIPIDVAKAVGRSLRRRRWRRAAPPDVPPARLGTKFRGRLGNTSPFQTAAKLA
jgi:hypothetical protein